MINRITFLFLLLIMALSGCIGGNQRVGEKPLARFTMLDGAYTSVYAFRGKKVVVAFWSMESSSSQKEIRKLNSFANAYPKENNVVFLTVSVDPSENLSLVKTFVFEHKLNSLQHVFSGNGYYDEAYAVFQPEVLPYIYVLDSSGVVVADGSGVGVAKKALD